MIDTLLSIDAIKARWPRIDEADAPDELAAEIAALLTVTRGGQLPEFIAAPHAEGLHEGRRRLAAKGLVVWSTNRGWIFSAGEQPRSPDTGRILTGFPMLTPEGAKTAAAYLYDLLRGLDEDRHGQAITPRRQYLWLEDLLTTALNSHPPASLLGVEASLHGPAVIEGDILVSSTGWVRPKGPSRWIRPEAAAPERMGQPEDCVWFVKWSIHERHIATHDMGVFMINAIMEDGSLRLGKPLHTLDLARSLAFHPLLGRRWCRLGDYDPEALLEAMRRSPDEDTSTWKNGRPSVDSMHGRPVAKEDLPAVPLRDWSHVEHLLQESRHLREKVYDRSVFPTL